MRNYAIGALIGLGVVLSGCGGGSSTSNNDTSSVIKDIEVFLESTYSGNYQGQYETTEEYEQRINDKIMELNNTIIVVDSYDILDSGLWSGWNIYDTYDADTQTKSIEVKFDNRDVTDRFYGDATFTGQSFLFYKTVEKEIYQATNGFGATVEVTDTTYRDYSYVFSNFVSASQLAVNTDGTGFCEDNATTNKTTCYINLIVDVNEAQNYDLGYKLSVSIDSLTQEYDYWGYDATYTSPRGYYIYDYYYAASMIKLEVYDKKTNKVLGTINKI